MEQLTLLYKFLVNRSTHIAFRVSIPFLVVIIALIINDLSGISRSYFLKDRMDKMAEIQKIEPEVMQTDTFFRKTFQTTKRELLTDHSYIKEWFAKATTPKQIIQPTKENPTNTVQLSYNKRIWLNITSMLVSYLIVIMLLIVGIAAFFNSIGIKQVWNTISAVVLMMLVAIGIGRVFKELTDLLIPIYDDRIWVNYTINLTLQFAILGLIVLMITNMRKKN